MEFTNTFRVDCDVDTTFHALTDLERVAPCLPGASLESVEEDAYHGSVKVRVGPTQMAYKGTARVTEADLDAKRGRIEAAGRETRGSGTARADVVATLAEDGEGTLVTVVTDLTISGKPAQFGRGVLAEVGAKIIATFAERLREMLEGGDGSASDADAAPAPSSVTSRPAAQSQPDEALDLLEVAGAAALKRLVPLVVGIAAIGGLIWWVKSR